MSEYAEAVRFDERAGGVVVGAVVELPAGWAGADEAEVVTELLRRPELAGLQRLHVRMDDAGEVVGRVAVAIAERPRPALRELVLEQVDFDPASDVIGDPHDRSVLAAASGLERLRLVGHCFFAGLAHPGLRELDLVGLPLAELAEPGLLDLPRLHRLGWRLAADDSGSALPTWAFDVLWAADGLPALRNLVVRGDIDGTLTCEEIAAGAARRGRPVVWRQLDRLELPALEPASVLRHAADLAHLELSVGSRDDLAGFANETGTDVDALVARLRAAVPGLIVDPPPAEPLPAPADERFLLDPRYQGSELRLWLNAKGTDGFRDALAACRQVVSLTLDLTDGWSWTALADVATVIATRRDLTRLDLRLHHCYQRDETDRVLDTVVPILAGSTIRSLHLPAYGMTTTERIAEALRTGWALTGLTLNLSKVTDDGAVPLIGVLPTTGLHELTVVRPGAALSGILDAVRGHPTLHTVGLKTVEPADIGHLTDALPGLTTMTSLAVQYSERLAVTGGVALAQALAGSALRSLNLYRNAFGESAEPVTEAAVAGGALRELDLSYNQIPPATMRTVCAALTGSGIERLVLDINDLCGCGPALETLLGTTASLRDLSLDFDRLDTDPDALVGLAAGLSANHTIERLDLDNNHIGPQGLTVLASGLDGHPSLRSLHMSGNTLGDAGARILARVLQTTPLEHLDVADNKITAKGVAALADAVAGSRSLRRLSLNENKINDKGLGYLLDAVTGHPCLEYVDLLANWAGPIAVAALTRAKRARPDTAIRCGT